jgi:hypothetical protein
MRDCCTTHRLQDELAARFHIGDLVRWNASALARRDPLDVPYAKRSVGIVRRVLNGSYCIEVEWPHAIRTVDVDDVEVLDD